MKDDNYPEILTDLCTRIVDRMVKRGVERQVAAEVALEVTEEVRTHWGGQLVYVPQGVAFEKRQEYERIWLGFTGCNQEELARKFKKSVSQVYRILGTMRAEEKRKREVLRGNAGAPAS